MQNGESKFSAGEVCLMNGGMAHGAEAVVLEIGPVMKRSGKKKDYRVEIAGFPGLYDDDPGWCCDESSLRKKRPPQTDTDKADEQFIQDLNRMLKIERVEA